MRWRLIEDKDMGGYQVRVANGYIHSMMFRDRQFMPEYLVRVHARDEVAEQTRSWRPRP